MAASCPRVCRQAVVQLSELVPFEAGRRAGGNGSRFPSFLPPPPKMKNKMIPTPPQQQHLHNGITVEIRLKLKVNVYRKQTQTKQAQEIQERSKGVSPGI